MTADGDQPEPNDLPARHAKRFRKVSTQYPEQVAEAYDGDLARAAAHEDAEVATTVRAWELTQGMEPVDWWAIGASERDRH